MVKGHFDYSNRSKRHFVHVSAFHSVLSFIERRVMRKQKQTPSAADVLALGTLTLFFIAAFFMLTYAAWLVTA